MWNQHVTKHVMTQCIPIHTNSTRYRYILIKSALYIFKKNCAVVVSGMYTIRPNATTLYI